MENRYKTKPGKILWVAGVKVTDASPGVELKESSQVREHVRTGRLIRVPKQVVVVEPRKSKKGQE